MIALAAAAVVFVVWRSSAPRGATPASAPARALDCAVYERPPPGADRSGRRAVADTYMFVHQPLAGNGTLTARVTSLAGGHTSGNRRGGVAQRSAALATAPGLAPWAKAGIIVEPDTSQGAAYAAVMVTGSHGVQMQYNYTHDTPGLPGSVEPSSPRWLRLTRAGDVITGYDSVDGTHWTEIGTVRLAGLPPTVQIGLFVTSPVYFPPGASNGDPSVATATFDSVSTQGDFPRQSWTGDAIGPVASSDLPGVSTWQQPSADAFTISGSGDIAPLVGGGGRFGDDASASLLVVGSSGSSSSSCWPPCSSPPSTAAA